MSIYQPSHRVKSSEYVSPSQNPLGTIIHAHMTTMYTLICIGGPFQYDRKCHGMLELVVSTLRPFNQVQRSHTYHHSEYRLDRWSRIDSHYRQGPSCSCSCRYMPQTQQLDKM